LPDAGQHSFIIYSNLDHASFSAPHLQEHVEYRERWSKLRRWLRVSFEPLQFILDSLHFRGRFERSLRQRGVDFVWFVTPAYCQVDTPYVYTIWDLQHRHQPWLPEVSSNGRWRFRENSYREVISRAAAIIVPNSAGRDEVVRYYQVP